MTFSFAESEVMGGVVVTSADVGRSSWWKLESRSRVHLQTRACRS
jgi:hypothetical protein